MTFSMPLLFIPLFLYLSSPLFLLSSSSSKIKRKREEYQLISNTSKLSPPKRQKNVSDSSENVSGETL